MTLSEKAWNKTANVYQAIVNHPFNQELMHGTLDYKIFSFYIEQDYWFLKNFAKSLAYIAARLDKPAHIGIFLQFAQNTIAAEQTIIAKYLGDDVQPSRALSPACLSYSNFLLQTCALEPIEVAIAAILPCFWIYQKVGQQVGQPSQPDNPFSEWIKAYASTQFAADTATAVRIFDELAEDASPHIRENMCAAFYQSSVLEYHFWNDAYELKVYDDILIDTTVSLIMS